MRFRGSPTWFFVHNRLTSQVPVTRGVSHPLGLPTDDGGWRRIGIYSSETITQKGPPSLHFRGYPETRRFVAEPDTLGDRPTDPERLILVRGTPRTGKPETWGSSAVTRSGSLSRVTYKNLIYSLRDLFTYNQKIKYRKDQSEHES